jgi:hypothetical protein
MLIYSFLPAYFPWNIIIVKKKKELVRMMFLEEKREYIKISFGVSST